MIIMLTTTSIFPKFVYPRISEFIKGLAAAGMFYACQLQRIEQQERPRWRFYAMFDSDVESNSRRRKYNRASRV